MDKDTALEKIKKCLNLAKSGNEHEAAAALRQAQKLMETHRVSEAEVSAMGVSESMAEAGATRNPTAWETGLASTVAEAFSCSLIFLGGIGRWSFIGVGPAAEIAQYAFTVLYKQLRRQRALFIKAQCKRLVPASKTRRADLFCDAWVRAVANKAAALAGTEADQEAISAYKALHYAQTATMNATDRNEDRKLRDKDWGAVAAGRRAGERTQLNHGVGQNADAPRLQGRD
ncbi:MAG: hypothetical protein GAK35_02321 [Herbaspirillum frisingense]|uniref:DUF2786 domain-containing protein n=1 Tax=Herbaspirillum frisingense TaxID=92645 RepID=A0A7V8JUB6_9BURK|nr:MAG: hypothetical protein GAK35_02321 [Herbaspirillum frisingense]